ncbi:12333_t:CDS:2, partial [Ambispora leptoticha]
MTQGENLQLNITLLPNNHLPDATLCPITDKDAALIESFNVPTISSIVLLTDAHGYLNYDFAFSSGDI